MCSGRVYSCGMVEYAMGHGWIDRTISVVRLLECSSVPKTVNILECRLRLVVSNGYITNIIVIIIIIYLLSHR